MTAFLFLRLKKELIDQGIDSLKKNLSKIIALIKPRLNLLSDLLPVSLFFFKDPENHNEKSLKKFKNRGKYIITTIVV